MAFKKKDDGSETSSAKDFTSLSFEEAFVPSCDLEPVKGLKVAVYGAAKVGKTHFSMTAPKPIYFVDTEGSARAISKAFPIEDQKQIFVCEVVQFADKRNHKIDLTKSLAAMEYWIDKLTDIIYEADAKDSPRGTIVIDSMTDYGDWLKMWLEQQPDLKYTKSGQMMQTEYGRINKKFADLMYAMKLTNWNLIITHKAVNVYDAQGHRTDAQKARWNSNTEYWVEVFGELYLDDDGKTVFRIDGDRFGRIKGEVPNASWPSLTGYIKEKSGFDIE